MGLGGKKGETAIKSPIVIHQSASSKGRQRRATLQHEKWAKHYWWLEIKLKIVQIFHLASMFPSNLFFRCRTFECGCSNCIVFLPTQFLLLLRASSASELLPNEYSLCRSISRVHISFPSGKTLIYGHCEKVHARNRQERKKEKMWNELTEIN